MTMLDRIKSISKKRGLSLLSVNDQAGLGKNAIYKWKTQMPSIENLEKVAKVLNVSTDYLLGKTEDDSYESKTADLDDDTVLFTYQGKPLSDEDRKKMLEIFRLMNGDNK